MDKAKEVIVGQKEIFGRRKYSLVLLSLALVTLGYCLAVFSPIVMPIYAVFVSGIIGLNGVYGGANVLNKWRKQNVKDRPEG